MWFSPYSGNVLSGGKFRGSLKSAMLCRPKDDWDERDVHVKSSLKNPKRTKCLTVYPVEERSSGREAVCEAVGVSLLARPVAPSSVFAESIVSLK